MPVRLSFTQQMMMMVMMTEIIRMMVVIMIVTIMESQVKKYLGTYECMII